ncbi:hypothetical protein FS842_004520, partial [Serendipita sp. 407]
MQDYNQAPYSPFNSGIPLRTGVTQANADIEVFLPRRPQTSQPLPGKPQKTQPPQRKCNVKATVPRTRRRRAKQHNDSPQTRTRIANLGEFGPRIMDHYAGDTDENRLSVLGEFETYMDQNDGRLPFDCIGARGPRNGGGKFFCRICSKNWPNLQKMMADLLGHWQLKPWHCELCEKSYQGLNEYTRHQGEVHGIIVQNLRCDRASSTDSLSSFAEDIGHSPGANESSRILGTPPQIGNSAPIPVQSSVRRPMARRTSDLNRNAHHHHHHHPYSPRSSPIVSAVLSSTGHLQVPTLDIGHGAHHRMDTYSQYAMEGINPGLGHFYAPNGYNRFYESMPAGSGAYPHDAQSYGIDLLSPTAGSTMGPAIASESTIGPVYGASVYGDFLYSDQDSNTSAEQDAEVWLGYSCGRGPGPNSQSVCWCMTLILLRLGTSECFTMGPR